MTCSLFVIRNEKTYKDQCFYGNGVFSENFDTILELLKEENVKRETDLFNFLEKHNLREVPEILNIAHCLLLMDRIVLCDMYPDKDIEFKVYNEIIENEN